MSKISYCPVCGVYFNYTYNSVTELRQSCDICDCCGCEFGYDDNVEHFEKWKSEGCNWFTKKDKPDDWKLEDQIQNVIRPWPPQKLDDLKFLKNNFDKIKIQLQLIENLDIKVIEDYEVFDVLDDYITEQLNISFSLKIKNSDSEWVMRFEEITQENKNKIIAFIKTLKH